MSKIEELQARIRLDYKEVRLPFLKLEPRDIIMHAYELAHYNEIADMFENLEEDNDWFDDIVIGNIINYQGNVFVKIYQSWLDYRHPEYYNFFAIEDLIDIVKSEF